MFMSKIHPKTQVIIFLSCFRNFLVIFVYYIRLDPQNTRAHAHTSVLTAQNGYKMATFKV